MFHTIESYYTINKITTNDAAAVMPVLRKYSEECRHVTEMGLRGVVTTWAILAAKPDKVVCIDWDNLECPINRNKLKEAEDLAKKEDILFEFICADTTDMVIENTDLLFIDTWHTYEQLILELLMHSGNVNKYIICHDTSDIVFPGMVTAIEHFLLLNKNWELLEKSDEFPGHTVIRKVDFSKKDEHSLVEWGWFERTQLLNELEIQRKLFYNRLKPEHSKDWDDYVNRQYIRFGKQQEIG